MSSSQARSCVLAERGGLSQDSYSWRGRGLPKGSKGQPPPLLRGHLLQVRLRCFKPHRAPSEAKASSESRSCADDSGCHPRPHAEEWLTARSEGSLHSPWFLLPPLTCLIKTYAVPLRAGGARCFCSLSLSPSKAAPHRQRELVAQAV